MTDTHFAEAFWYAYGSAGTHGTCDANIRAYSKFGIIPRMLVDASPRHRSLEVCISYPIVDVLVKLYSRTLSTDDALRRQIPHTGPGRTHRRADHLPPRRRRGFVGCCRASRDTVYHEHRVLAQYRKCCALKWGRQSALVPVVLVSPAF